MKRFREFITEVTYASLQAKRFGYVGDGHGGWYNRATGEFEAKSIGGRLRFYNKNQLLNRNDPKQSEFQKNIPLGNFSKNGQVQPPVTIPRRVIPEEQNSSQKKIQQITFSPPTIPKTKGNLIVVFGRFNPPTSAHSQIFNMAANVAAMGGDDYSIIPSRTQDNKKNPLDPDTKISFMKSMYPDHSERFINDSNITTIFDALRKAHTDGYSGVKVITGPDRVKEFEKLTNNYNGQLYRFDEIEILPVSDDSDENNGNQLSSSSLRLAAAQGDFITFRNGLPKGVTNKKALELFNAVRHGMNIKELRQEGYNVWEIAPEYDLQTLRENYVSKHIFREGDFVESLNTGLVGKIIRRGTNYLICVSESGIMFKSWIKDVKEAYEETTMARMMRLPHKPNTLIGTTGFFKYAAQMTPGAVGVGTENLQASGNAYGLNLINNNIKDIG
jgi:hypothetical protein